MGGKEMESEHDQELSARYHDLEASVGLSESSTATPEHDDPAACPLVDAPQYDADEKVESVSYGQHRGKRANRTGSTKAIAITLAALGWLAFLILYFRRSSPPITRKSSSLRLDTTYQPPADFDIVINMYREDPDAVASTISQILSSSNMTTNHRIYIYNKNEEANLAELAAKFPTAQVMRRPNIGREGETYLHHILSHWDHLAKHTLFMQAAPDDADEFLRRIRSSLIPETGMLTLGFIGTACDCNLCSDPFWHDYSGVLAKTYELANNGSTCGWLLLSYKGQFIASAARIRGAGAEVYEYLYGALVKEDSWAHQRGYWEPMGLGDSMNSPALGFSLERLWFAVMQCSEIGLIERCPTMISQRRLGVGVGVDDCQCRDSGPGAGFRGPQN